jgi:hypothetical protein
MLADLPARYTVRLAGSGGRYSVRSSATLPLKVRIEYGQPIRPAITVEGICGYAAKSSRIRGSNASATDPRGGRWYLGGPSLASAAFTVFREIPSTRAICKIGICSARRNRWISAQSSTLSTCFLPGSARARVSGKLVNFRLGGVVSIQLPTTFRAPQGAEGTRRPAAGCVPRCGKSPNRSPAGLRSGRY